MGENTGKSWQKVAKNANNCVKTAQKWPYSAAF